MDKIYSRPRINFFKLHKKRKFKIKFGIFLIFCGLIIPIILFLHSAYPILIASCETAAGSKANEIITTEVMNVMDNYSYDELFFTQTQEESNIVLIQSNTILINKITNQIIGNIQKRIDNSPTTKVYINLGSVSGVTILRNFGPKFDIELETAGTIKAHIKSEFQSVGVNQTLHKIYLEINTSIGILTPFGCFGKEVETENLLTESVIVGSVPETYYNLQGLNDSQSMEMMQ